MPIDRGGCEVQVVVEEVHRLEIDVNDLGRDRASSQRSVVAERMGSDV